MPTPTAYLNSKSRAITRSDRGAFFVKSGDKKYYAPKAVFKKGPSGTKKRITLRMSDSVPLRIRKMGPSGKKLGRPMGAKGKAAKAAKAAKAVPKSTGLGQEESKLLREMIAASEPKPKPKPKAKAPRANLVSPGGTRYTSKKKMATAAPFAGVKPMGKKTYFA
jgi:hypothetical protein